MEELYIMEKMRACYLSKMEVKWSPMLVATTYADILSICYYGVLQVARVLATKDVSVVGRGRGVS